MLRKNKEMAIVKTKLQPKREKGGKSPRAKVLTCISIAVNNNYCALTTSTAALVVSR